jgi:molecular chaperone GrpE
MGEAKEKKKETTKKRKKLHEKNLKESEEYLSRLKYLQAEFENYKKRMQRERQETTKFANEKLILSLLEVVDNLERAIEAGEKMDSNKKSILEGIQITYKQLMSILEKEGLECIRAEGGIFDPYLHECVMTENTDKMEEDTVVQVLLKGYTLNSRVIRHSKVKISKR